MAYDIENGRDSNNSPLDEQTLREIYGRHFRMVVQDGGVASVMASYNMVNGIKSTQNKHLLTDVLRDDFGFKGFVLSDWWAMPPMPHADADTTCSRATPSRRSRPVWTSSSPGRSATASSKISSSAGRADRRGHHESAARVLEQKFRFKADKRTARSGSARRSRSTEAAGSAATAPHIALSEKAAVESMVLLKNENDTLPINRRSQGGGRRRDGSLLDDDGSNDRPAASSTSPPTSDR